MRGSATWTTYRGGARRVAGRVDGVTVKLRAEKRDSLAAEEVPVGEVGVIEKVRTAARWRGGSVIVGDEVSPGRVGFHCDDRALAERESLHGDQHQGWTGVADVGELSEVTEQVTVLRDPEAER